VPFTLALQKRYLKKKNAI